MLNSVATTVLTCCSAVCSICDACNCANCDCGCPCGTAAATATSAPTPAPITAQATGGTSYRTYSYQPAPVYQPVPVRSFRGYGNRMPAAGFHDAGWKIRGGF
jgi:hypothetical protein